MGNGIHKSCKKLSSYILFLNPTTININSLSSFFSTSHFLSFYTSSKTLSLNPTSPLLKPSVNPKPHFTTHSSSHFLSRKFIRIERCNCVQETVLLVKKDENGMEFELDRMGLVLNVCLVSDVFKGLNTEFVSGLRFFNWVREKQVSFYRNSDFCSLIIDNIGRMEDYDLMFLLLKEFSEEKLCLTEKAFAFIPVCSSNYDLSRGYVIRIIEMLNKVGGSSRNSGIFGLIKMLCSLNAFDLGMFVMEETARRTSYYNVLIWAKCRSCSFQDAYVLFDEMRRFGCDPNANSYNYLLGSLCKNSRTVEACKLFGKMEEFGYVPDEVTFEVIICHACRLGRLDFSYEFLNQMMSRGIEPRHTTHAAFIKGYFYGNRFVEAYKYVVSMCNKYKSSGNVNYSLLASLLHKSRRVVEAREILVDMMEKGLKPNFPVYIKVLKDLHKSGLGYLVADLKSRFSKFK